jgi:natural product precursor
MKKLNLEMLRLTSADVLERSQMKKITGGYHSGSCGFQDANGTKFCGVSKSVALSMTSGGGRWCCASCGTSSYCS